MNFDRNELESLVYTLVPNRTAEFLGLSCNDIATIISKPPKHITQVLQNLTTKKLLYRSKEKRGLEKLQYFYFKSKDVSLSAANSPKRKTCNKCQRFSGLNKCILLEQVKEDFPWLLQGDLKARANAVDLTNVTACEYFEERVNGHVQSKTMIDFLSFCIDKETLEFRCPIKRCNQIIEEFSSPYLKKNFGSNVVYCPHCGSPMNFAYSPTLDRYQMQYWDSRYVTLQTDYRKITDCELPSRYKEKRPFGISITKEGSFYLDLENETIFVGNKLTPEKFSYSKDITYFSLRQLTYIAVKYPEDYLFLKEKLHSNDPLSGRDLYSNIEIFPPLLTIPSVEPTLREIGGNEIIIATGATFTPMFRSNILMRQALLEKKLDEFLLPEFKGDFEEALRRISYLVRSYTKIRNLDYKTWQQLEGGIGSIMLEPFKKEAQKFLFETPSRERSRKVRGEEFLPFRLFYARSPYACLKNGVNKEIDNILKIELYNELGLSWNGLRGWCHRNYPFGLFLDSIEQIRLVALLLIHEAIINEEIKPSDFIIQRGKRYEKYYCIEQDSEALKKIKRISRNAWRIHAVLSTGQQGSMKNLYKHFLIHVKELLNKIALSSTTIFEENSLKDCKTRTVWKKLQEAHNSGFLSEKEKLALLSFSKQFFSKEFIFQPLTIQEIV